MPQKYWNIYIHFIFQLLCQFILFVDKLYDPDDDEVYDPESAFVEDKSSRPSSSSKISKKRSRDEPAFSSDESPSPPPPKAPVTSTSGFGAADSTKKETPKKKVEDTKAEPMAGFKGLPTGIASILFGSSTSSTASTTTVSTIMNNEKLLMGLL